MAISSQTLFHFTYNAENLIGILNDKFQPEYCLEVYSVFETEEGPHIFDLAIPMTCFCDLPLSNVAEHLDFYGNYGIGLTKEWGIKQGVNPVLYLSPESDFNTHIQRIGSHALKNRKNLESDRDFTELMSFIKPIEGKMSRRREFVDKYFYDEREWRFVPRLVEDLNEAGAHNKVIRLTREEFLDDVKRADENSKLRGKCNLSFKPNDIKYIIVSKESEIKTMIKALRSIKSRYDSEEVDILISCIISAEQISQDF